MPRSVARGVVVCAQPRLAAEQARGQASTGTSMSGWSSSWKFSWHQSLLVANVVRARGWVFVVTCPTSRNPIDVAFGAGISGATGTGPPGTRAVRQRPAAIQDPGSSIM